LHAATTFAYTLPPVLETYCCLAVLPNKPYCPMLHAGTAAYIT